jgi:Family of unknown function (DUF6152)
MTTRRLFLVVGVALIFSAGALSAHHAFSSEFDENRPIVLRGAVTKTEWVNPHSWIHIEVTDSDGKVTSWAIECGAPNSLMRRGLNKNSIPIGTKIVVDGYQARDGSTTANAKDITTPDGKKFFVGSSGTGAPYEKDQR